MSLMWDEIREQPLALERCLDRNVSIIKDIVDTIKKQDISQVVIAARGTSDHAAVYGKYVIELLTRIPVALAASSIFTIYGKGLDLEKCLVIGISQSGKAADVLEVLKCANNCGGISVGITNHSDSPIASTCRFHLSCEAGLERSVAATKTFSTQIFLLALLASEWVDYKEMKLELSHLPEKLSHVFEVSRTIEDKTSRYRFMNECFVLARGINYSVSLEAALKIQETTYVRAKAFATSDFQHGPIAMIDRDIPVIIFAPDGPSLGDVSDMLGKLKASQVETIVVSNNQKILEMGTCAFPIPPTDDDMISPFYNVVVAQMFACQLAMVKGLNPDSPRGLNKVTITR
ncbi:MAG: SIS domain-containing protein [Clostridiales bacterium]|nr:SIS domain-containing protein [Clostridiales bacterium]